jgi:tetratricopeptide (TPR) repeat protein
MLVLLILLVISIFILRAIEQDKIESPFEPTPLPTRSAASFAMEGETHFMAGNLNESINTYQRAIDLDPQNHVYWYELARIQTYSSTLMTTDAEQLTRLTEALESADMAIELAPEDSTAHAIRSFVLDWLANPILTEDESESYKTDAEQAAVRALQLDNQNTLALVYYAEILVDQQKWLQAEQYSLQALENDPTLMDVHRIAAYVQESLGNYGEAIREYEEATMITPNLTFLYIRIGLNYRVLERYDTALEYFEKAAIINEQLGIKDPIPYLAIGKTYTRMGEFFIAALNVRQALRFNPTSPDIYGQLGIVYQKSRNYEGAIEAFKCAVQGCTPEESCAVLRCDPEVDTGFTIEGMPLSGSTVVYYYTYGSILAAMHRPYDDKCTGALEVLSEVRASYSDDPIVIQIIETSEDICASFGITP